MPKYWGGNYFAHGRFPEVGQKQKTEKKEEEEEERLNDGDNNGQAMHGARMAHAWRTQAAWANYYNYCAKQQQLNTNLSWQAYKLLLKKTN